MKKLSLLMMVLSILLTSCDPKSSKEKVSGGLKYDSPEFSEKFNSYISVCNYYTASDKGSSWNQTLEYFYEKLGAPDKKDLKKEDVYFGNYMWGIDQSVKIAMENVGKSPDLGETDKSMLAFSKAIIDASSTLKQLESYYKGKNYLDDNYVKAEKLYQEFIVKQNKANAFYDKLINSMTKIKDNRDNYFLESDKKQGRLIRYQMGLSMRCVKQIFMQIDANKIGPDFKMNYDKLSLSIDELNALATDDEALKKSNITLKSTFNNYLDYLTSIKGNLRVLLNENLKEAERESILKKLDDDYTNMIDDYNRL